MMGIEVDRHDSHSTPDHVVDDPRLRRAHSSLRRLRPSTFAVDLDAVVGSDEGKRLPAFRAVSCPRSTRKGPRGLA